MGGGKFGVQESQEKQERVEELRCFEVAFLISLEHVAFNESPRFVTPIYKYII